MIKTEVIAVQRIRGGTLIKLILIGNTIGCSLLFFIAGIFSLFGVEILNWNDQPVTGISGLISSPFIGAFFGFVFGLFTAFFTYIGLRILSRFKPMVIEYIPYSNATQQHTETSTD